MNLAHAKNYFIRGRIRDWECVFPDFLSDNSWPFKVFIVFVVSLIILIEMRLYVLSQSHNLESARSPPPIKKNKANLMRSRCFDNSKASAFLGTIQMSNHRAVVIKRGFRLGKNEIFAVDRRLEFA